MSELERLLLFKIIEIMALSDVSAQITALDNLAKAANLLDAYSVKDVAIILRQELMRRNNND